MRFLTESLLDLDNSFKKHGGRLYVFFGDPVKVFENLFEVRYCVCCIQDKHSVLTYYISELRPPNHTHTFIRKCLEICKITMHTGCIKHLYCEVLDILSSIGLIQTV